MSNRLSILCGSLEPGTNGVGDYSRLLAEAFVSQGYQVQLISLADHHVSATGPTGGVVLEHQPGTDVVRLSKDLSIEGRLDQLAKCLQEFQPNLVSLQYVLTSFHPKGMPWAFNNILAQVLKGYRTHVMLHEVWFGIRDNDKLSQKIYGFIQKRLLFDFLRKLTPELVTLSNPYYQKLLRSRGIENKYLPIYATVPQSPDSNGAWLNTKLLELGQARPESFLKFGFFGGIFPTTPGPALLNRARDMARLTNKPALILSAGRGGAGKYLFQKWAADFPDMTFWELGALPDAQVYSYLMGLDYGLTGYPHYLLGKSSQVAAMLAVGLPVLVGWQDMEMAEDPLPPQGMELILRADRPLDSWPPDWHDRLPRGRCSVASADDTAREMIALLG